MFGHPDLNGEFGWSDERGLNSLQMLSYLFAALKHSTNQKNKDIYTNALLGLLNEENHYHINILNQKSLHLVKLTLVTMNCHLNHIM